MKIIPAIDIRRGRVVRLYQGNIEDETFYHENPAVVAKNFERQGAGRIHIVNLDGAFGEDERLSSDAIFKIREQTSVELQVGGGIRNYARAKKYIDGGIDAVVVGSVYFDDVREFGEILSKFGDRIIMSADVKDDSVRTHGWEKDSGIKLGVFMKDIGRRNVRELVVTAIEKDGTLSGVDKEFYAHLVASSGISIIASGGVAGMEDIGALFETGITGVIIGKAIYENKIDLRKAVEKYARG